MTHDHVPKARRTQRSELTSVPTSPHRPHHRRLLMIAGVTFSMLVIATMYAASFRYMKVFDGLGRDNPRWSVISREFFQETAPVVRELDGIRETLGAVVRAKLVQEKSIEILKAKVQSAAAVSETP